MEGLLFSEEKEGLVDWGIVGEGRLGGIWEERRKKEERGNRDSPKKNN